MSRFTASDLPMLRNLRSVCRKMIDAANRLKTETEDVGELFAVCAVIDDLQGKFESVGRELSRLERCPS